MSFCHSIHIDLKELADLKTTPLSTEPTQKLELVARTLTPKRAYAAVVLISDRVGFLRFFFMNKFSGDSWMYPYQRTPTGNPYIRVCMGYFIPKNPQRTPAKYHGHVRYGYTRPCPLKFSMEEAWMKKISFLKHHLPSKQNYFFCDCENDVSGSI